MKTATTALARGEGYSDPHSDRLAGDWRALAVNVLLRAFRDANEPEHAQAIRAWFLDPHSNACLWLELWLIDTSLDLSVEAILDRLRDHGTWHLMVVRLKAALQRLGGDDTDDAGRPMRVTKRGRMPAPGPTMSVAARRLTAHQQQ